MKLYWIRLRIRWARLVNLYLRLKLTYHDWKIDGMKQEIASMKVRLSR